jgi:hypothetical protein
VCIVSGINSAGPPVYHGSALMLTNICAKVVSSNLVLGVFFCWFFEPSNIDGFNPVHLTVLAK